MKKSLLLICSILLCGVLFAQRTVDLQTTLLYPAEGDTIKRNTPFVLGFTVKNNGPDPVTSDDTVLVQLTYKNKEVIGLFLLLWTKNMEKDSLLTITIPDYELPFTASKHGPNGLCLSSAFLYNGPPDVSDPNTNNNESCKDLFMAYWGTGTGDINAGITGVKNFPVPAGDELTISYNLGNAGAVSIKIYDISGREVVSIPESKQATGAQSVIINTAELKAGIYFYELNADGRRFMSKFTIIR